MIKMLNIQQIYAILFKKNDLELAVRLYDYVNVVPDKKNFPYSIQDCYYNLVYDGEFYIARTLYKWWGIKPIFDEKFIQSIYFKLFMKGNIIDAKILYRFCRIFPDFKHVQKYYSSMFKEGLYDDARDLYKWCKIKPDFELIKRDFKNFLNMIR